MIPLQIQFNSSHDSAVIVGGTSLACDALIALRRAGWSVRIVATELCPRLRQRHAEGWFVWNTHEMSLDDLHDVKLVFAASESTTLNHHTERLAAEANCLFCNLLTNAGDFRLGTSILAGSKPDEFWRNTQVCLVGAGPGDPGLLTLDANSALAGADVVLHDRLVSDAVLERIPTDIERIYVGKRRSQHHYSQDELNALIIKRAHSGQRVVRLKGGDPFMFGRGGEELTALMEAGVATRVIPGISAGSGCATYADIPLTHRDYASSCQFITAYGRDGQTGRDWPSLVRERHTLVVYMGVSALGDLCSQLVEHGMSREMPAALIERGTLPEERVMTGTIATLPQIAEANDLRSPALLIIGEVVKLRERIRPSHRQ